MIKALKNKKWYRNYLLAVKMHLSIVWRRWHDYEDDQGKVIKTYIGWSTAWTVAKGVWLDEFNARSI